MEPNIPAQPVKSPSSEIKKFSTQESLRVSSNKIKTILIGVLILLVLFLFGGIYYLGALKQQSVPLKNNNITKTIISPTPFFPPASPTPTIIISNQLSTNASENGPIDNWNTYINITYNYSFKYPSGWVVKDNKIESPNKLNINFNTGIFGVGGRCNNDPNINFGSENITFFSIPMYLFYVGDKTMNTVSSAYIIPETYPCPNIAFFNVPYVGPIQEGLHAGLDSLSINYDDKTKRSMQDFKSNDFYIAKKIISTFQVAKSKDPEMTTVCTNEKANIISLVNNFENFQMKKDAKDVLALFTSPIVENDISTYNNLLGLGKNPDSNYLYSQTSNFSAVNFSELSYGILNNNPVYDQDNGCLVYATEERTTTLPASVNLPWGMDTTFDVVKQDNIWKIDKYYNTGTGISKYGGWDETL